MNFSRPLIINFKNYSEISGPRTVELARTAEKIAADTKVSIVLAPPQASLALVAKETSLPVIAQHLDDTDTGSTTGFLVPELARSYGIKGSIINHSEHRISNITISNLVQRLRALGMTSIVCAQTPSEVSDIAKLNPDFIAIEPPQLIGTGRAVSKESPTIITKSIEASAGTRSKVICGAGISDKSDVLMAVKLGAQGVLVASSIIKAESWANKIKDLALGMTN